MENVCIEVKAWKMLKQRLRLLTSEVEMMRKHCVSNARDTWLDAQEVCKLLGISKRSLQEYRTNGKMPFSMFGGKVYFKEIDIHNILEKGLNQK